MTGSHGRDGGTGIVVVFYHPDPACIARANRLVESGHRVVVVDNTERVADAASLGLLAGIGYLANGANLGVATALNQGVEHLLAAGCTQALLFDQDSEPSDRLLAELPRTLRAALATEPRVALVGPAYEDKRLRGVAPFVRFGYFRLKRIVPTGSEPLPVDFLITSGSCVNLAVWQDVGPMDDSLFIDFVDLEWCVRAASRGYVVLGAPALRLEHELGGTPVRIFGRNYPAHGPTRHYYAFRNVIALFRRAYVPLSWKSTEVPKLPARLVLYVLFMRPRLAHLRMSLLGIWHGLIGRSGAL